MTSSSKSSYPLILPKSAYERWLGREPDPHDLLTPFAAELMLMWPVSTRVNSPDNDDSSLLDPAAGANGQGSVTSVQRVIVQLIARGDPRRRRGYGCDTTNEFETLGTCHLAACTPHSLSGAVFAACN
jgi:hypothetical protein